MRALTLFLLAIPCSVLAGGFSSSDEDAANALKQKTEKIQSRLGHEYWMNFPNGCKTSSTICETPSQWFSCNRTYKSDKPVKIKVDSIVKTTDYLPIFFYVVSIGGSGVGYIEINNFSEPDGQTPLSRLSELDQYCAFKSNPDDIRNSIRSDLQKRENIRQNNLKQMADGEAALQKAEDALAKKPGAHIGMTAKQVKEKTNWGEPDSVNRTVTGSGVDEQWVYDGGGYLYFRNGKLRAIQN